MRSLPSVLLSFGFGILVTAGLLAALFFLDDKTAPRVTEKTVKSVAIPIAQLKKRSPKPQALDPELAPTPSPVAPQAQKPPPLAALAAAPNLDLATSGLEVGVGELLVGSAFDALSASPAPALSVRQAAQAIERPSPRYPSRAAAAGIEGEVVVRMRIDESGRVVEAVVVKATPPGVFESAALAAARRYRFRPAKEGERAVASTLEQRIYFRAPGGAP